MATVIDEAARQRPNGLALKDAFGELSFEALRYESRRAAAALAELGIGRGDRFAIWAPNSTRWVIAALGGMMRGAVLTPINTRLKGAEANDIMRRARVKAVFIHGEFLGSDYAQMLKEDDPKFSTPIIAIDDIGGFGWSSFLEGADGFSEAALDRDISMVEPSDISDIIFTSGTTGRPKGVIAQHRQVIGNAHAWGAGAGLQADDRYLGGNPFFHTFGYKAGWLPSLIFGAAMFPQAIFDVAQVFEIIERERITVFPGPPTIFEDMLKARGALANDISSLRVSITGAAVVPAELICRMKDELEIDTILTAYGLTECGGTATVTHKGDPIETTANSVGSPIDGVAVRIVNDDGDDLAVGEHGEVLLKSDHNFVGYLDDAEATRDAFTPEGWLKTGDIGVLDERGYLKITGRKKEMFITGGFNCYPAEIEFNIAKHPDITEVAVIGAPDERLGEVGIAFVVRSVGCSLSEQELLSWASERMANYKLPRSVVFVDSLPRTALGKIARADLETTL